MLQTIARTTPLVKAVLLAKDIDACVPLDLKAKTVSKVNLYRPLLKTNKPVQARVGESYEKSKAPFARKYSRNVFSNISNGSCDLLL